VPKLPLHEPLAKTSQALADLLAEENVSPEDFITRASSLIKFLRLSCKEIESLPVGGFSSFGMAMLSIELSLPSEAKRWLDKDLKEAKENGDRLDSFEMQVLRDMFDEYSRLWAETGILNT